MKHPLFPIPGYPTAGNYLLGLGLLFFAVALGQIFCASVLGCDGATKESIE